MSLKPFKNWLHHRQQLHIPIIALTGSNGKTTTKELIDAVLSKQFKTTATKGNLNNHIGVPLTLLSMTSQTEIGIVEMGANHLKEIALLSEIANPIMDLLPILKSPFRRFWLGRRCGTGQIRIIPIFNKKQPTYFYK